MNNRGQVLDALFQRSTIHQMADFGLTRMLTEPADVAAAAALLLNGRAIDHPVGLVRRMNFDFYGQHLRRGYVWAANLSA